MNPIHHPEDDKGYELPQPNGEATSHAPQSPAQGGASNNSAVDLIRSKISSLYESEPDAKKEQAEAEAAGRHRSKHQNYMYQLTNSGKSLADIQTAWHTYYVNLPNKEKHEVWQEFYASQNEARNFAASQAKTPVATPHIPQVANTSPTSTTTVSASTHPDTTAPLPPAKKYTRSVGDIKEQLLGKINNRTRLNARQHIQSLLFGISMGAVVLLILLFGFFNQRFIAPFITPSRNVSATPIIIDPNGTTAVSNKSEIIIPKINVEIPVVYDVKTIDENQVELGLERGVVHYATTPMPGELGNVVIFGHSSNNILNPGKYKFAFVLLHKLKDGDLFYLDKDGVRYAYKVYHTEIVAPTDVSVLGPTDKPATATLITCDPPGTSLHRLIVTGVQISPDPSGNTKSSAPLTSSQPSILPSNAPSLGSRVWSWFTHLF